MGKQTSNRITILTSLSMNWTNTPAEEFAKQILSSKIFKVGLSIHFSFLSKSMEESLWLKKTKIAIMKRSRSKMQYW